MSPLQPIHSSMRPKLRSSRLRPQNMTTIAVATHEQGEALERIALEIFTDMTNAGATFQESLAAIYLSGLHHAVECQRRINDGERGEYAASTQQTPGHG